MDCPNCLMPLGTSLTSCDRCGWQIPLGRCIPRAEHDRLMAEARNMALEEAALYIEQRDGSIPCRQEIASAIRAMKG